MTTGVANTGGMTLRVVVMRLAGIRYEANDIDVSFGGLRREAGSPFYDA